MQFEELVHPKGQTCQLCRLWVAHTFVNVERAGQRGLDEQKIRAEVMGHRAHGVLSVAHYHDYDKSCNERCIA